MSPIKHALAATLSLLLAAINVSVQAADSDRSRQWDFTVQLRDIEGESYDFSGGSTAQTDNTIGFGIGLAYNFNEHLSVGGDLGWASIDYDATVRPAPGNASPAFNASGSIDTSTLDLNVTYNLLAKAFTPFVSGALGLTYIDSRGRPVAHDTDCHRR